MPAVKKEVHARIKNLLEERQKTLRTQIRRNRCELRRLAEAQTTAKRELAALGSLLRSMNPKR